MDIHTSPTQYVFGRTPQFQQTPMGLTFGVRTFHASFGSESWYTNPISEGGREPHGISLTGSG